jgi:hypothetical protein
MLITFCRGVRAEAMSQKISRRFVTVAIVTNRSVSRGGRDESLSDSETETVEG